MVPDTAAGVKALAASDVRTLARYPEFTLVEARGADFEALRAAGAERRDDMRQVRLGGRLVDPAARASLAAKTADPGDEELVLVQFVGPVKDRWLRRLRATGARVVGYMAQNAYVVHARGDAVDRVAALVGTDSAVRAVTPLRPADRLEKGAAAGGSVTVQTVAGEVGADARSDAAAAGRKLRAGSTTRGVATQYLHLSAAEVAALAGDPAVLSIEPYSPPVPHDERASQIVAGNLSGGSPSGPGYLNWLAGQGFGTDTFDFAIDVTDTGIDDGSTVAPGHPDFYVNGVKPGTSRLAYSEDYTSDNEGGSEPPPPISDKRGVDCSGHGTNVASIAAGYNDQGGVGANDSAGFNYGLGAAPRAQIGSSKIFRCAADGGNFVFEFNGDLEDLTAAAYEQGARISNNSWGSATDGAYGPDAWRFDTLVRDAQPNEPGNQELVAVFSAGNEGQRGHATVADPGTSKNGITVGAAENVRPGFTDGCGYTSAEADNAGHVSDDSSRGPTDDLRIKPDVVAPGTHMIGARPTHAAYYDGSPGRPALICNPIFPAGTLYNLISGTSQAAPVVSGAAALIRDWYSREIGPEEPDPAPSPAMTKAILVDSATDLAGGADGKGGTLAPSPSMEAGWGRPNLTRVFGPTQRDYIDQTVLLNQSGTSEVRAYTVPDASAPVRVTLAWTDPAPASSGGNAFVNDLDLIVTAGGRRYRGNMMSGGLSIPGGVPDTRNNVESVVLPAGAVGQFAVEVRGTNIAGDGVPGNGDSTDQDFALVVSNAAPDPAPELTVESVTVDDGSGGDGDSVLEPREEVTVTPTLRNRGNASAHGVSGTAAGGGGLELDSETSTSFPDIDPGEMEEPDNGIAGAYLAAAPCGADAVGTLTVDTTSPGQSQTLPLVIPTGEADGTPLSSNAASPQVPKAIPDDNPAGVTSSLTIPERGRIKDLNVRITGIAHTWVGDLSISLTGPDGTTVTLVRHPGGPDNDSNNLSNVTFDDEGAAMPASGPEPGGTYRPQGDQLSRFDGKQRRGTWTLRVRDLFDGDTGAITGWGLTTERAVCDFDTTPPTLSLNTFPGSLVNQRQATFGFTTPDDDARFECRLDAGLYEPCASPKIYGPLGDGVHTFRVQAIDGSGNESTEVVHTWTVDATPPDTTITAGPARFTPSGNASIVFSGGPDATAFQCRLDGQLDFEPCASPLVLSGLAEGTYTVRVRALDTVGNVDPTPAAHTWTVDRTAPVVTLRSPAAGSTTGDATPRLSGTAGRAEGDTPAVTLRLYQGEQAEGAPTHTLTAPVNPASGTFAVNAPALDEGRWTVVAQQVDAAGNAGSAGATFTVAGDKVPSMVALPAVEDLAAVRRRGVPLMAACVDRCTVRARLTVGGRTARMSTTVRAGTTKRVRAKLDRRVRRTLARASRGRVRVTVTLVEDGRKTSFTRRVALRSSGLFEQTVRKGNTYFVACSERCSLTGAWSLTRRSARALRLRSRTIATDSAGPSTSVRKLVLRPRRNLRRELLRARSLRGEITLRATGTSGPTVRLSAPITLRR